MHACFRWGILALLLGCRPTPSGTRVVIPGGAPGIGFDDLRYSRGLHRVLVPSGRAGVLALIEPESGAVTTIGGFSTSASYEGGHDFGVTAVDEGAGFLFATDRTGANVHVIDPKAAKIVASASVAAGPDYVRYVAPTNELWISEPDADQIEIFSLSNDQPPKLSSTGTIAVKNGPESLVIDAGRGRAYTHRWQATTLAIDVKSRSVVGEWKNGCAASRGIDLEPEHGYVLAACNEGTVTVLDAAGDGKIVSSLAKGSGYDVIGYNAALRHVYLAGGQCACLTVLGLSSAGQLSFLGREDAPSDTHCAIADDVGSAWVCEPHDGSLRKIGDHHPATR